MAYSIDGLAKITSSGNSLAANLFSYKSTADTLATIIASGYFNDLIQDLTNGVGTLKVGDVIFCQGSDNRSFVRVTAVTTNVTVSQFADISSISDGELTAAMTALTEGSIMIGNASGYGSALDASTDAQILVGNGTTATSVAVSGDVTIDNAGAVTIAAGAVDKAMLASTVRPSHMIVYADQVTTTGGGGAAEATTVTGAAATDYAFIQIVDDGTNTVTVVQAAVTENTLTVTFSADPGNDAVFNYQIVRATT